jgi:hypothetical protein
MQGWWERRKNKQKPMIMVVEVIVEQPIIGLEPQQQKNKGDTPR